MGVLLEEAGETTGKAAGEMAWEISGEVAGRHCQWEIAEKGCW